MPTKKKVSKTRKTPVAGKTKRAPGKGASKTKTSPRGVQAKQPKKLEESAPMTASERNQSNSHLMQVDGFKGLAAKNRKAAKGSGLGRVSRTKRAKLQDRFAASMQAKGMNLDQLILSKLRS